MKNHCINSQAAYIRMKRGFTLIELTVVLAIVGLIIGGGMATLTAGAQQSAYNSTVSVMNAIDQALYHFANANGRLPCPGDLTLSPTSASYGLEAGATTGGVGSGDCKVVWHSATALVPAANNGTASTSVAVIGTAEEGGVPARTLRLPDSYMYDGWGRRIRYAVDPSYTVAVTSARPTRVIPGNICGRSQRALTVYDVAGSTGTSRTAAAAYVLVSHGNIGHGAYSMYGGSTMFNAGNLNTDTLRNCSCTSAAAGASYTSAYTQTAHYFTTAHAGAQNYYFDDVVSFKEPWQLANTSNSDSAQVNCPTSGTFWVTDGGKDRVFAMSTSGAFQMQIGTTSSSGNTDYLLSSSVAAVAVDKYGNIWVHDTSRILQYSPSGVWMMTLGGNASDPGDNCAGKATSTSSCSGIVNFDLAGHTTTCCIPPSTGCSCTATTSSPNPGQFGGTTRAKQMAFDSNGNLWATDPANKKVIQFNTATGQYMNSFQVTLPDANKAIISGIAISGSTIYVMVPVQKPGASYYGGIWSCTSAGTCTAPNTTGCSGAGLCSGTGTGQWNANGAASYHSDYLWIDSSNNVWGVDEGNDKIMKFNANIVYQSTVTLTANPGGLTGVFVDPQGYLWVSSENTGMLYQIDPSTGNTLQSTNSVNGSTMGSPQLSFFNAPSTTR